MITIRLTGKPIRGRESLRIVCNFENLDYMSECPGAGSQPHGTRIWLRGNSRDDYMEVTESLDEIFDMLQSK